MTTIEIIKQEILKEKLSPIFLQKIGIDATFVTDDIRGKADKSFEVASVIYENKGYTVGEIKSNGKIICGYLYNGEDVDILDLSFLQETINEVKAL